MNEPPRRIRQSLSRGTLSCQLGHYEMSGEQGKRRSVFEVDVHLGEHAAADGALEVWPVEIERYRQMGREEKAAELAGKLDELRSIS